MKIEHYQGGSSWVDISDYLVSSGKIPRAFRNRDFTLRADYVDVTIAGSLRGVLGYASDFEFSVDEQVRFKDDSDSIIWVGKIDSSNLNYETLEFSLSIRSTLIDLKTKYIDYDTIHATFAAGTLAQYWTDYLTYNSVQLLWALECAFSVAGLSLTVPNAIKTTSLFTRTISTGTWNEREITFADLYFDEYQLYCLGKQYAVQPYATAQGWRFVGGGGFVRNWGDIPEGIKLVKTKENDPAVDCFAFVSEALTSTRLSIKVDNGAYTLAYGAGTYTIADDDKYGYEKLKEPSEAELAGCSWVTLNPSGNWLITSSNRDKYYDSTATDIDEIIFGDADPIAIMPNFRILFADTSDFSGEYGEAVCEPDLSADLIIADGQITGHLNPIANRYDAVVNSRVVERITCPYQSTHQAVEEHNVDLEQETSEIIQEV